VIQHLLMKCLQAVHLSPEEGLALLRRVENDTCNAEVRLLARGDLQDAITIPPYMQEKNPVARI
jgi:hypothetical protein